MLYLRGAVLLILATVLAESAGRRQRYDHYENGYEMSEMGNNHRYDNGMMTHVSSGNAYMAKAWEMGRRRSHSEGGRHHGGRRRKGRGRHGRNSRRRKIRGGHAASKPWRRSRSREVHGDYKIGRRQEDECQDIELWSDDFQYHDMRVSGCSVIKSMTLNWAEFDGDCDLFQTFGFDRRTAWVDYGCSGSFRVCCRPKRRRKVMRKALRCRPPFYEESGHCIRTSRAGSLEYVDAAQKCSEQGGRLLLVDDFIAKAGNFRSNDRFRGGTYFIGGASSFSEVNFEVSISATSIFRSGDFAVSHALDIKFALNIADMYRMVGMDMMRAFRRFGRRPSLDILNMESPLNSKCLAYDVGDSIEPVLVDCDTKANYICEQIQVDSKKPEEVGKWSSWINLDTDRDGDENENLCDIIKAVGQGKLDGLKPGDLCESPLAMQCRDVETKTKFNRKKRHGFALSRACEKNSFRCKDHGQTCPDIEVRFMCPDEPLKDCAVNKVRKFCERQGKRCEMTPVGAKCVKVPDRRSGYEVIGKGTCKTNSKTYNVSTCVVRGDPHYHTLDGKKFDFNGACSYIMASTTSYGMGPEFPPFTITTINNKKSDTSFVSYTKGFILELNGIKYTFTEGKFYYQTYSGVSVERSFVDYADHQITIIATPKDRNKFFLTINTNFCLQIKWDNKYMLQVKVPEPYMNQMTGMCGNYDNDKDNDLKAYGKELSPEQFGDLHIVGGRDEQECVDVIQKPKPCPKEKFEKFTSSKHCGVLNPDGDSPFAAAVVKASKTQCNIRRLREIYEECVMDHCWSEYEISSDDRCYMLEANIEEILTELNIRVDNIDKIWRDYSDCADKCAEQPNMEYKSNHMPSCQNTCLEPSKSTVCCDKELASGCVCKEGYFLDGEMKCVPLEECDMSCNIITESGEKVNLKHNETMVLRPCETLVTCVNGEAVEKELETCSEHGKCVENGLNCKCDSGYRGDGHTCKPAHPCRKGYVAIGTKCYKLVRERLEWHSAAINCGTDGASLVRYDTETDIQVEKYFALIPELLLMEKSKRRKLTCESTTCNIPSGQMALTAQLANKTDTATCKGKYRISEDRRQLIVDTGCAAEFVVNTVDPKEYIHPVNVVTWVGGNTKVLDFNERAGRIPFQVDPPRLVDSDTVGAVEGCYTASSNSEGQFLVTPKEDCKDRLPSICEYDNTLDNSYDPLDMVAINERLPFKKAVEACKAIGRPLASLKSPQQQRKAEALVKDLGRLVYISAVYDKTIKGYRWEDGERLVYTNWRHGPEPNRGSGAHYCTTMDPKRGTWTSRKCDNRFLVLCGPPANETPKVFTPYYPIDGKLQMEELKLKLQRSQVQDYVCDEPTMIECSAQSWGGGWVTQRTQSVKTIVCRKDKILCREGRELDCSTFRVRFLCPFEENQCTELEELNAPACSGGQKCFPVTNHYICKCPQGSMYNERTRECHKYCGECSAWGDPHYTTFSGNKYDFMGTCNYKFTGVCDPEKYQNEPTFEIFTKNKQCGKFREDGTCINWLEVRLKNIPVMNVGGLLTREDFVIRTKAFGNRYWVNDRELKEEISEQRKMFRVVLRQNYFSLMVHSLDLTVFLNGNHLRVRVPERFSGDLCGLCGDCNTDQFRLRNGTLLDVPRSEDGYRWNINAMKVLGEDWKVVDKDSPNEICSKNNTECSTTEKLKLQGEKFCGVFLKKDNFLQACFDKMSEGKGMDSAGRSPANVKRQEYHHNCIYDICGAEDPSAAICSALKTFAQECAEIGVNVHWRSPNMCPMKCGENEVYRVDASCQKQCNAEPGAQDHCTEEPAEGCACADGHYRQNNKCVPKEMCGCRALDSEGNLVKYLAIGEETILPQCTEKVTCTRGDDGKPFMQHEDYALPQNAICSNTMPPTYICAKGYKFDEDGVTCIRKRDTCTEGYTMMNGLCLAISPESRIWRQGLARCNEADGTLVHIDTDAKIDTIKDLLEGQSWSSLYVSGRVRAKNFYGLVLFETILTDEEAVKPAWANFHFHTPYTDKLVLSNKVDKSTITEEGMILSVVAKLDGGEVIFEAVPSTYMSHFVCEERGPPDSDDDTEWTEPCNTDTDMEDDGDQETRFNMEMDETCLVCPKPMDVKCENAPGSTGVDGVCQVTGDGIYYSCHQGKACADKTVSTKCFSDINECEEKRHDCPKNSKCINTMGAYMCKCEDEFPLMALGECTDIKTCEVRGPKTAEEFIHDLKSFSGSTSTYDLDCRYALIQPCDTSKPSELPFITVYDISARSKDKLQQELYVVIEEPNTGKVKVASLTPEGLKDSTIQYGTSQDRLNPSPLDFTDDIFNVMFEMSSGSNLVIRSTNNLFKVYISFPLSVKLDISSRYMDQVCGICTAKPPADDQPLSLTKEKLEELEMRQNYGRSNLKPNKCKERVPGSENNEKTTPAPVTTKAPVAPPNHPPPPPPPPPPPKPSQCEQSLKDFCKKLSSTCAVSRRSCEMEMCSGSSSPCEYLTKNAFASCNTGSRLKAFLKEVDCDSTCPDNSKFQYMRQSLVRTCNNPFGLVTAENTVKDDYGFQCVCATGFLLSRNTCVRPTACGCKRQDGAYMPLGSSWRSDDCTTVYTCNAPGEVNEITSPCGKSTECVMGKVGYQCQCEKGTYGNPFSEEGCSKGEDKPDSVCYDYVSSKTGETEKRCDCKDGFVSDCDGCVDIDECREGIHTCDLSSQKCVNSPGSFKCECQEGFSLQEDQCVEDNTGDKCQTAQTRCSKTWKQDSVDDKCAASTAYRMCLDKITSEKTCPEGPTYPQDLKDIDAECADKQPDPNKVDDGQAAEPIFTSWTSWEECRFTSGDCGLGIQIRTREQVPYGDDRRVREVKSYDTKDRRVCYSKCPGTDIKDCPCDCACDENKPVCGTIGPGGAETFKSECHLMIAGCTRDYNATKLYNGACKPQDGSERRICSKGPIKKTVKFDKIKNGLHCVGQPVTIATCDNMYCEGRSGSCCKPLDFEHVAVDISCYSPGKKEKAKLDKHIYMSATKCGCVAKTQSMPHN